MKTAQIIPGQFYGYSKSADDSPVPVLALDNKLWTMGETWSGSNKGYTISPADGGTRAQTYSSFHNQVGVPVLVIRNSGWLFSRGGDNQIVSDPAELLAEAAKKLSVEALMKQQKFDNRPKTFCTVEAKWSNGEKIELKVVLTTALPSRIKGDWTELLGQARKKAEQKAKWERQKQEQELARNQRDARIKSRLDAVLGVDGNTPSWRGEHARHDCIRHSTSEFRMQEATLIRLLELAEKGAQK